MKYRLLMCSLFFSLTALNSVNAQETNPITGDLTYNLPLISLPGPNGESITLQLGYNSDIRMDQDASWIGLGWSLSAGEISRHVQGVPDDYKDQASTSKIHREENFIGTSDKFYTYQTKMYGPIYFGNFPYDQLSVSDPTYGSIDRAMDVYRTSKGLEKNEFHYQGPNFDQYKVSAPGISGSLQPYFEINAEETDILYGRRRLKIGDIILGVELTEEGINVNDVFGEPVIVDEGYYPVTATIRAGDVVKGGSEFYASTITRLDIEKAFGITLGVNENEYTVPSSYTNGIKIEGLFYEIGDIVKVGDPIARTYPVFDRGDENGGVFRRLVGERFQDFDDKDEDGDIYDYLIENDTSIPSNVRFTPSDIVQFDYKTKNGNKIEYFSNSEIINNQVSGFLESQQINSRSSLPSDGIGAYRITDTKGMVYHFSLPVYNVSQKATSLSFDEDSAIEEIFFREANAAYARSWKLTAITGLNYIDVNNDGVVNDGDTGYWISYNYEKLNNLHWQQPKHDIHPNRSFVTRVQDFFANTHLKGYEKKGSLSSGESEKYLLKSIETSTHKVFAETASRTDILDSSGLSYGKKLKGLYLIDKNTLLNSSLSLPQNPQSSSDFTSIKSKSLSSVVLTHNYSLCKGLHDAQPISIMYTDENDNDQLLYKTATYPGVAASNGKLSLESVTFYQKDGVQMSAPYEFDYDAANLSSNPNYNPKKVDYWGYYNPILPSNPDVFHSRYRDNTTSHEGAWCLKSIVIPTGAVVEIDYELKNYSWILEAYNGFMERNFVAELGSYTIGANNERTIVLNFDDELPVMLFDNINPTGGGTSDPYCTRVSAKLSRLFVLGGFSYTKNSWFNKLSSPTNGNCTFTKTGAKQITIVGTDAFNNISDPDDIVFSFRYNKTFIGGSRVKEIKLTDDFSNKTNIKAYEYEASYATIEAVPFNNIINGHFLNKNFGVDRHSMPPQVVNNGTVEKVVDELGNVLGSKQSFYRFPFAHYTVNTTVSQNNYVSIFDEDYTNSFGLPSKEITYDANGNELSSVLYHYEKIGSRINKYSGKHTGISISNVNHNYIQTFTREQISKVITTQNGLSQKVEFSQYDPNTGQARQITTTDASGKTSSIINTPASNDIIDLLANNRLSEHGTDRLVLLNNLDHQDDISSEIETKLIGGSQTFYKKNFSQLGNVNGIYSIGTTLDYYLPYASAVYNGNDDESNWEAGNTVTLIGKNHMPLESIASSYADGGYTASKYDVDEHFAIAQSSNSNYASFTVSSFEKLKDSYFNGYLKNINATIETNKVHSGTQSIRVAPNTTGVYYQARVWEEEEYLAGDVYIYHKGLIPGKRYRASVWVHDDSPIDAALEIELQGYVLPQGQNDPSIFSFNSLTLNPNSDTYAFSLSHGTVNIDAGDVRLVANSIKTLQVIKTDAMTAQEVKDVGVLASQQSSSPWVQNSEVIEFIAADMPVASFAIAGDPLDGTNTYTCNYTYTKQVEKSDFVVESGDWKLIQLEFEVPEGFRDASGCLPYESRGLVCRLIGGDVGSSSDSYFDDFRLQPIDADVVSYVYDLRTGLVTETLNNNNLMTRYVYDAAGRQREVYQEKQGGLVRIQTIDFETAKKE